MVKTDAEQSRLLPIAVDLDGTLILTDSMHEAAVSAAKLHFGETLKLFGRLRDGKAAFRQGLAARTRCDAALFPYNVALLRYLRGAKQEGRRIGLFTACDQSVADRVAEHLGLFDSVRGSDGRTNLCGQRKIEAIRETFGESFTYVGDSDMPIFDAAQTVVLVGRVERLRATLPPGKLVEATFPQRQAGVQVWIKALRLRHWAKNVLVFVPPVLGLQAGSPPVLIDALLLFLGLGLLASATYILNDLLDLDADRRHPVKRLRPFAAGAISLRDGLGMAALLLIVVALIAVMLPLATAASLAIYLGLTLVYSLVLKRVAMIDVVALAALFTLRIWAGGTLLPLPASPWLLTFSMLFFLGLAMIKRYAELERVLRSEPEVGRARGYTARDLPILLATGVSSGISAVVIFTIYLINEQYPRHIYAHPDALWGIMPVLLVWTLRVWHLSVHGRMNEDPVVFALKDRFSLVLGLIVALLLYVAWV